VAAGKRKIVIKIRLKLSCSWDHAPWVLSLLLDKKEEKGIGISQLVLPEDLPYDEVPDETIFYGEINPWGILCTINHPFSTVDRFGDWYSCRGQDKGAGIHSSRMHWHLFTKDKDLAVKTAK